MPISAIDFGTTNSVAGVNHNGDIDIIALGKNSLETRTALFYSFEDKEFYVGDDVLSELEMGIAGRYLQSLKSFLGHKELIETTLGVDTYYLDDLIAIILRRFRWKMEQKLKQSLDNVVLGRPVRFNDRDNILDKEAQNRLESSAKKAGFKEVFFQYEPIAAALAYEQTISKEELILVADIGGGTTDYSIIKVGGKKRLDRSEDILANHGVYIGGNNFDATIIKNQIAPHLGQSSLYVSMGKEMEVPYELYFNLSEWHLFQQMFDRKVLMRIEKLIMMAKDKYKIERLQELITQNLYFDFASKIVNAKIELSSQNRTLLDMDIFSNPFKEELTLKDFENSISQGREEIKKTMYETLKRANVTINQIDKVFLTGGSTLVPSIKKIYTDNFDTDKIMHTDVFSSVGYGLTLYAGELK